jgi:2-C-methyl-D-erythritol 4-phosphate cytidylyltransferase
MSKAEYAIIVAGGKGTRMKSALPKQFLEIDGLPILMHTMNAFYRYSSAIQIILVLPPDDINAWNELCDKYNFHKAYDLQSGGATRFQSVRNGLEKITSPGLVAIHDGVRPLVTTDLIARSFELAEECGSAIATVSLKESIRKLDEKSSIALDRSKYRLIQTPQTFQVDLIKDAYKTKENETLTDDASVFEAAGGIVALYEGSYENIKVTTMEDLVIAEALMKARMK